MFGKKTINKIRNKLFINAMRQTLREELPGILQRIQGNRAETITDTKIILKEIVGDRGDQQQDLRIILNEELPKILNRSGINCPTGINASTPEVSVEDLLNSRFRGLQPIDSIHVNSDVKRLNLVTDSIEKNSLLGGVATAIIVAVMFCKKYKYSLRVITRNAVASPENFRKILEINGLDSFKDVEFYSDVERNVQGKAIEKLTVAPNDVFFATSWWSAQAIKGTTIRKRFFYIIQEVETFFYPHGEDHYLCSRIMNDSNIDYIINSHYLNEYFMKNEKNIIKNGIFFEPAFSKKLYKINNFKNKKKKKLFFYSRPNNPRNMFHYGVYLLDLAIKTGVLDTEEWDIYFAGQDVPKVCFSNGYKPINKGLMDWEYYGNFLGEIDLTLSLMYTPHPSYPPYDAASSGSIVLTNKCLNKTDFSECKNILMEELDEEKFMEKFEKAIELAKNMKVRKENFEKSTISHDWNKNLVTVMSFMKDRI